MVTPVTDGGSDKGRFLIWILSSVCTSFFPPEVGLNYLFQNRMFLLPFSTSNSMLHTEKEIESGIVWKAPQGNGVHKNVGAFKMHMWHHWDTGKLERQKEQWRPVGEHRRAGVCFLCLPIGLHVRDKRGRPLSMFAQWVLSKCVLCVCAVYVQSVYAFQRLKNAAACVGVSHCLCSTLNEPSDVLHACLRYGRFHLFRLFWLAPHVPLIWPHNQ